MSKVILAATTGAAQSDEFYVLDAVRPVVVQAHGFAGVEAATLQKYINGGFRDVYDKDGNLIELHSTRNAIRVVGEGRYRVDKDATVASIPIELDGPYREV